MDGDSPLSFYFTFSKHSFYYLKSYVEGTGVVHLAAGIV